MSTELTSTKSAKRPIIEIDYARYEKLLDNPELPEEQRRAFLDALWRIMVEFVSLGYGIHPVQQALEGCGQDQEPNQKAPSGGQSKVCLSLSEITHEFESAATPEERDARESVSS